MFGGLQFGSQPAATPTAAEKAPRQDEKLTVVPATVRAIEAGVSAAGQGGELKLFGSIEPSQVVLVAQVESLVSQTASLELSLNDGTGRIKARYFITGEAPTGLSKIQLGSYVTVVGGVRAAPELHIGVINVRVVAEADEVSYHLVEVAHQALRARRGAARAPQGAAGTSPVKATTSLLDRGTPNSPPKDDSQEAAPPAEIPSDVLQSTVQKLLEADACGKGEVGATVAELLLQVQKEDATAATTEAQLLSHLQAQVLEGMLFTTIDDDHYSAV